MRKLEVKEIFTSDELNKLSFGQLLALQDGYDSGFPFKFIKECAIPELSPKQIRTLLKAYYLSDEGFQHCKKLAHLKPSQLEEMELGYEHGLSKEEVSLYACENRNAKEMEQIRIALECEYSEERIQILLGDYNWLQMLFISKCYELKKPISYIKLIAKEEHNWKQMWQLYCRIADNVTLPELFQTVKKKETWFKLFLERIRENHKNVFQDPSTFAYALANV